MEGEQRAAKSLERCRRQLALRASREVPLDVVLAESQDRGHHQIPGADDEQELDDGEVGAGDLFSSRKQLDDGTARLHCRWWNLPFMEKYFSAGDEVIVFGKPVLLKPRTMDHPETEVVEPGEEGFLHFNRITPIYPLAEGLPQRWLRSFIWRTLDENERYLTEPWPIPVNQFQRSTSKR